MQYNTGLDNVLFNAVIQISPVFFGLPIKERKILSRQDLTRFKVLHFFGLLKHFSVFFVLFVLNAKSEHFKPNCHFGI